jgi:tetrapyrrole methylase family protein/MazG family protein
MAPYLIEETYELVEAIHSGSAEAICEELGDVLFHLIFIAAVFQEQGIFNLSHAMEGIQRKMVRRHPHVFGDSATSTTEEIKDQWETIKKREKRHSGGKSILDSIPAGLPGLVKAYRVSSRAARAGFDWDDLSGVMDKTMEEWREFKSALLPPPNAKVRQDAETCQENRAATLEFGDLLFTLVNVGRWTKIHPETAVSDATLKFERRFRRMEKMVTRNGREFDQVPRAELERAWDQVKLEGDRESTK